MKIHVLSCGVGNYSNDGIGELPKSISDADKFFDIIQQLGVSQESCSLINPTVQEIKDQVQSLFHRSSKEDIIVYYHSGHGLEKQGLIGVDSEPDYPEKYQDESNYFPFKSLLNFLVESEYRLAVILLDCCYSGEIMKLEGYKAIEKDRNKNLLIFCSAQSGQESYVHEKPLYGTLLSGLINTLDQYSERIYRDLAFRYSIFDIVSLLLLNVEKEIDKYNFIQSPIYKTIQKNNFYLPPLDTR